jgi:hypothetical protein
MLGILKVAAFPVFRRGKSIILLLPLTIPAMPKALIRVKFRTPFQPVRQAHPLLRVPVGLQVQLPLTMVVQAQAHPAVGMFPAVPILTAQNQFTTDCLSLVDLLGQPVYECAGKDIQWVDFIENGLRQSIEKWRQVEFARHL